MQTNGYMEMEMDPAPQLTGWLEERQERFTAVSDAIWAKPETGLRESAACALQSEVLARDGFTITGNIGGLPTAFVAEWRSAGGDGAPVLGFLGEYDALPGLSQASQSGQQPLVQDGPGHGCGHNLLGTAAMAAAMAYKAWLTETGGTGTVRYYGCPAEETITGKVFMARAGVFDDLDAALTWHPNWINTVSLSSSLAVNNMKFRFRGQAAHAAASPELGRSALDAVELMNIGVNYLREHVVQEARIHYVITNGGGAPNVVPDDTEVWYFVRAPRRDQVEDITARVRKIAEGATLMTGTTMTERFQCGAYNVLPNYALGEVAAAAFDEIGPLPFSETERAYAQQIADAYPPATRLAAVRASHLPEALLSQSLVSAVLPSPDSGRVMSGSTDVADVSWVTPTVQIATACWVLGVPAHSWGITATGAMSIGHKGMLHAAKTLALIAVKLHQNPGHLAAAREEFRAATEGHAYRSPLPEGLEPDLP